MSIREQALLRMTVQRMACTSCGAQANASCNCGVAYVPKAVRVREAIAQDPDKSNHQIARDTGADPKQVRRERQRLGGDMSPPDDSDASADADHETGLRVIAVRGFFNRAAEAKKICTIDKLRPDDITEAMIEAALGAAAAWEIAAHSLRGMKNG